MAGRKFSLGWLRRIRQSSRRISGWRRRIQQWYWQNADDWPLSALRRYVKALLILFLWVLAAIGLFYLLRCLLPDTIKTPLGGEGTEMVSKESIALLGSLLTALIGFGFQQWKGQKEEEEQRRREEEDRALRAVEEEFSGFLARDLSMAARRYGEFRRKSGVWQSLRVRTSRESIWERMAPPELQCAVAVIEQFPESRNFEPAEQARSLRWAYKHLDDEWRSRAAAALLDLESAFPEWTEQTWRAILSICPEITLGRGPVSVPDRQILQGLRNLGLSINPFGSEKAETDAHLLKARVIPSWWRKVETPAPGLFFTAPQGGRTAAALLLAYDALSQRIAFPIYCRIGATPMELKDLAQWTAKAIARYMALSPISFTKCPYTAKMAIKRLLSGYLPADPSAYLQQAGLPSVGDGRKVLEEFQAHLASSPSPTDSQSDLLTLLGEARLADFPRTLVLADVQGIVENEETVLWMYALGDTLSQAGVIFQAFLAVPPSSRLRQYGEFLEWPAEDLRAMLGRRLRLLSSDETLDAWCDLKKWERQSAEERLVAAAGCSPQRLIRLGNALLRRIGEKEQLLNPQDLNDILGPVYEP